jgi:hypothetical protein
MFYLSLSKRTRHIFWRYVASKVKLSCYRHADDKVVRRYSSYSFSISGVDMVSGELYAPFALYPRERTPGTHCIGGWVGLRAGLSTEARGRILCLCRGSNLSRSVCSWTLCSLYIVELFVRFCWNLK